MCVFSGKVTQISKFVKPRNIYLNLGQFMEQILRQILQNIIQIFLLYTFTQIVKAYFKGFFKISKGQGRIRRGEGNNSDIFGN